MQTTFRVPGTDRSLEFERDDQGRVTRISSGPVEYFHAPVPEDVSFGGGFVRATTLAMPHAMLRSVAANGERWTETYRWNDARLMSEVDGVEFTYDRDHRVTACRSTSGNWFYAYSGEQLTVIDAPGWTRQIVRDSQGRPARVRETGTAREQREYQIHYDAQGRRLPSAVRPTSWHVDDSGRLWTITGAGGRVLHTYLWNDFHCFGRIDGPPGDSLAAVFSLDLTGTPVRVIERGRVRRVPRDAFGEALLAEPGVPGLYSGMTDGPLVRLPFRCLDPRTGAFDSPDPFTGLPEDPRRIDGYQGPLLSEFAKAGPYTVARNNPLSLADPTGAISDLWWLIPSALTWSYQNTVASIFGFWLTMDFTPALVLYLIPNLLTLFQIDDLKKLDKNPFGGFFDLDPISAKNFGAFGLRSAGLLSMIQDQTWTYQFLVNETGATFDQLDFARLFQPDLAFTPTLYGTILRCVPSVSDDKPFLLTGQHSLPNGASLTSWSRSGGGANPVMAGSLEPTFPNGALHFNAVMNDRSCPQNATLVELTPQAPIVGTATTNIVQAAWPGDAQGVAQGMTVALISTEADITKQKPVAVVTIAAPPVTSGANTTATFDAAAPAVVGQTVRLRGLGAPLGPDANVQAKSARELDLVGTTLNYVIDNVIRADRAGQPPAFATIARFRARLNLDAPLPALTGDIHVFRAAPGNQFNATILSATSIRIDSGVNPGANAGLVVGTIPATVDGGGGTNTITLDRDISSLGGANTPIKWRLLTRGVELGVRKEVVEAAAQVTYEPAAIRNAPTAGFVLFEASDVAARAVTGRDFDGLVTGVDLPDPAAKYDVRLLVPQAPDVADVRISTNFSLAIDAATAAAARAFHVLEFGIGGISVIAPPLLASVAVAGSDLTATLTAGVPVPMPVPIIPSQVVVLDKGGSLEVAVVKELRTTVQFTRNVPGRDDNLEALKLAAGPAYPGDRMAGRRVRVHPVLNGDRVDMPRFIHDELVLVTWDGGKQERFYRVDVGDGSTFTALDDDEIDPAFSAVGALSVQRLVVVDPATGSSRLGRQGKRAAADMIDFAVWSSNALLHDEIVAIVGDHPIARRVTFKPAPPPPPVPPPPAATRPLRITLANPPKLTAPFAVAAPNLVGTPTSRIETLFQIDSKGSVHFTDQSVISAGTLQFVLVPYVESGPVANGKLKAGSVRVPDDHENASLENTRREAVIDHELTHTLQCARLGPWLFTWWPNWVTELIGDIASPDFDGPKYTQTVQGTYREHDAELEVPAFADISLTPNDVVQLSQDGRTATISVFNNLGAVFSLGRTDLSTLSSAGFRDGPVGVRRQASQFWRDYYRTTQKVLEFVTIGQLMNLMCTASYGGLTWLVMRICQAIRGTKQDPRYRASVTSDTVITLDEGVSATGLTQGTQVAIQKGDQTNVRNIAAISDRVVTIDSQIPLTGPVEITVYRSAGQLFGDDHQYFRAQSTDRNLPAVIKVDGLALKVDDRVVVRTANGHTKNTKVTAKNSDGTVEIEDPVLTDDTPKELLVAKLGTQDPLGWLDQFVLDKMHIGFLQYLHDPYGQIHYRARPQSTFAGILTRSARYLLGTKSWGLPFLTGYFWWDNAYRQDEPETSGMEQEASFRSGDTYCPLGSLHGTFEVVGDVARYWVTGDGGNREESADMIVTNRQDAPGVRWQQFHELRPSAAANPGYSVSDVLSTKDATGKNWQAVASRAWVPANSELERSSGSYVTFTRPPVAGAQHAIGQRNGVTVVNPIGSLKQATNAQDKGPSGTIASFVVPVPPTTRRVQLEFLRTVQDVGVNVAAIPVAEFVPAVPPAPAPSVKLIPFQIAAVSVTPNGARQYRTTVSQPELVAKVDPDDGLTLEVGNVPVGKQDFVEISRFYPVAGDTVVGIGPMHLASDVHIAVRRFNIQVTDQLIFRATKDPTAAAVTEIRAGETLFLMVPAPLFASPAPTIAPAGLPVLPTFPSVNLDPADPADAVVRTHLGIGGVLHAVAIARTEPPEEADQTLTFNWRVGTSLANSAPVQATLTLKPHFLLNRVGAVGFAVGVNADFTLESSDGRVIELEGADPQVTVVAPAPGTPATNSITLKITAAGARVITVRDTSAEQHAARRRMTVT